MRVPIDDSVHGQDVEFEVHPARLRLAVNNETLLEGDFGGHQIALDGERRAVCIQPETNDAGFQVLRAAALCTCLRRMHPVPDARRCAGCFWSIESEGDQRFVEITIEKGADEQWKQILESDSSASAKAKVTDYVFFDIEEVPSA